MQECRITKYKAELIKLLIYKTDNMKDRIVISVIQSGLYCCSCDARRVVMAVCLDACRCLVPKKKASVSRSQVFHGT